MLGPTWLKYDRDKISATMKHVHHAAAGEGKEKENPMCVATEKGHKRGTGEDDGRAIRKRKAKAR